MLDNLGEHHTSELGLPRISGFASELLADTLDSSPEKEEKRNGKGKHKGKKHKGKGKKKSKKCGKSEKKSSDLNKNFARLAFQHGVLACQYTTLVRMVELSIAAKRGQLNDQLLENGLVALDHPQTIFLPEP